MHPVFEKLHPAIQKTLAKHNLTEPQIKAIPAVFSGSPFFTLVNIPIRRYHLGDITSNLHPALSEDQVIHGLKLK
jgi:hypothetical protein